MNAFISHLPRIVRKTYSVINTTRKEFSQTYGSNEASALTYYSVLSIVPILAISFAVATGFNLDQFLKRKLVEALSAYESEVNIVFEFVENLLNTTSGGLIAGISVLFLLYTSISLFNNITNTFNKIWRVLSPKPFLHRLTDFLAMLFVIPILFMVSMSISSFLKFNSEQLLLEWGNVALFEYMVLYALKLIPFVVTSFLVSSAFILIPETKVSMRSAIVAAMVTTILFYAAQWLFLTFQIGVSKNNAIYGSFSALPLFFMWIRTSWMILVFGLYLCKNLHYLENSQENENLAEINIHTLKKYSLVVLLEIIKRFQEGRTAISKTELYKEVKAPNAVINKVLEVLKNTDLISVVLLPQKQTGYQPYSDISQLDFGTYLARIEQEQITSLDKEELDTLDTHYPEYERYLLEMRELISKSKKNMLLKDFFRDSH